MRFFICLLCLMLLRTLGVAGIAFGEEVDGLLPASVSISGGGSSAGKSKTAAQVSAKTEMDAMEISYPASVKDMGEENLVKAIPFTEPRTFESDGIYVWRDENNIWNMVLSAKQTITVSGKVKSSDSLRLVNIDPSSLPVAVEGPEMTIGISDLARKATVQFRAYGSYIDFDLIIKGAHDPSQIYLGATGENPHETPFRLEDYSLVSTKDRRMDDKKGFEQVQQGGKMKSLGGFVPQESSPPSQSLGGGSGSASRREEK